LLLRERMGGSAQIRSQEPPRWPSRISLLLLSAAAVVVASSRRRPCCHTYGGNTMATMRDEHQSTTAELHASKEVLDFLKRWDLRKEASKSAAIGVLEEDWR